MLKMTPAASVRRRNDIRKKIEALLGNPVDFAKEGLVETAVTLRYQLMELQDRQESGESVDINESVKLGGALSRAMRALGLEKLQPKKSDKPAGNVLAELEGGE